MKKIINSLLGFSLILPLISEAQNNWPPSGNASMSNGMSELKIAGIGPSAASWRARLLLDRADDYRGAGVWITSSGGIQNDWYMGVPYAGNGFTIGNHQSQPEYKTNSFLFLDQTGRVGIGTTTPSNPFEVKSASSGKNPAIESENDLSTSSYFYTGRSGNSAIANKTVIENGGGNQILLNPSGGNVGIGVTSPSAPLSFKNSIGNKIDLYYNTGNGGDRYGLQVQNSEFRIHSGAAGSSSGGITFGKQSTTTFTEHVRFTNEGNVGIGTTTIPTGFKLAVDGKAIMEEVNIQLSGQWPDYVFSKTYDLKPLSEVSDFIQENSHLPEVPTAEEIEENGLNLGQMNSTLLQKIEELTLYLIEQNEKISTQSVAIKELQKQVDQFLQSK